MSNKQGFFKAMTTQDYKDKNIIQDIQYKEFSVICKEYQIVETATKNLLDIANDLNTPLKVRVNIYKWVVEMNIGKPKQMEIGTEQQDKKISAGIFIDWEQDNRLETLTNELISRGMTKEQIDKLIQDNLETRE